MKRIHELVCALVVGALVLAGCGGDAENTTGSRAPSDVMFAQMMIPHHEQAIEMADLAPGRAESAELLAMAEQIKAAQVPEIALMTGWLESWGQDVVDHSGHGMSGSMMGMMSEEDLAALAAASGAEFDRMWLEMMIEHHEGAIVMAEMVQASELPEVRELAEAISTGQRAEIETMRDLLGR